MGNCVGTKFVRQGKQHCKSPYIYFYAFSLLLYQLTLCETKPLSMFRQIRTMVSVIARRGLVVVYWRRLQNLSLWKFWLGFNSRHLQASCCKQLFGVKGIIKQLASAVFVKASLLIPPPTKKQQPATLIASYKPASQINKLTNSRT